MKFRWLIPATVAAAGHISILCLFAGAFAVVVSTGGSASPYFFLLSVSVLLSVVAFRPRWVLTLGAAVALCIIWVDGRKAPTAISVYRGLSIVALSAFGILYSQARKRERSRLVEALAQKSALLDAARIISASDDLESAVESALEVLPKIVPDFRCAAIFLEDDTEGNMRLYDVVGCERNDLAYTSFDPHHPDSKWKPTDPAPLYISDANSLQSAPVAMLDSFAQSAVCLCLQSPRAFTSSVGMLYVSSGRVRAFSNVQIGLLQEFADLVGFPLQKIRVQEGLQNLAFTDALTGLANYRYFRAELEEEVKRASRYRHPLSLIMLDLDLFKTVNDGYGHQTGDSALRWLGEIVRHTVREADFPARYGGEEFAVICSEAMTEEAMVVAERIRASVSAAPFVTEKGNTIPLTISAGVASYPTDGMDDIGLIRAADAALYEAKQTGRNRVLAFERSRTLDRSA